MGMAIFTNDDWTAAQLTVDDGTGPQVWSPTATDNNAKVASEAFESWYNVTFAPNTAALSYGSDAAGGMLSVFVFSALTTVTANAAAVTLTGIPAGPAAYIAMLSTWKGTLWPTVADFEVGGWLRHLAAPGVSSGVGAVRPGVPGLSHRQPTVQGIGTAQDVLHVKEQMVDIALPATAWIWQRHLSTWRYVYVGAMQRPRVDGAMWRIDVDVIGVTSP
jgi:hypothetical protein